MPRARIRVLVATSGRGKRRDRNEDQYGAADHGEKHQAMEPVYSARGQVRLIFVDGGHLSNLLRSVVVT